MTKLFILQGFTRILFVIIIIVAILTPGFLLIHFISPESVPPFFTVNIESESNVVTIFMILWYMTGFFLFIYSLYLFRNLLQLFAGKKIFETDTIKTLHSIGRYILIALLMIAIPDILITIINGKGKLSFDDITLKLFTLILGLFFMVLSEVFQIAKNIKEENDLTV